jgi:ATP-dependent protease Clp ATPase subunit
MSEEVKPIICRCSFCGKSDQEVAAITAGEQVWICVECWLLCLDGFRPHLDMTVEKTYVINLKATSHETPGEPK